MNSITVKNKLMLSFVFFKRNAAATIGVIVVLIVILFWYFTKYVPSSNQVIRPPTPQEYEAASQKPQHQCLCWDDVTSTCLPMQVCQLKEQAK